MDILYKCVHLFIGVQYFSLSRNLYVMVNFM